MFKQIIKFKAYAFIGTLITAGIIVSITYNMIQANNNKNMHANYEKIEVTQKEEDTEKYDELQKQIDELKLQLEGTQLELANVKEDLLTEKDKVISLNTQISALKKSNKNFTTTLYNYDNNELSKHLEDVSTKNAEQQNLLQEKEQIKNDLNTYNQKLNYLSNLERERELINSKILLAKTQIKKLEAVSTKPNPNLEEIEQLEKEIASLTLQLESIETEIENVKLTTEENQIYSNLMSRLKQIEEKLLQY